MINISTKCKRVRSIGRTLFAASRNDTHMVVAIITNYYCPLNIATLIPTH